MKKKLLTAAAVLAAYAALLTLLVYAESFSSESVIRTFWDALWYSLVTMTTVGYGDLYPVTVAGRLIGIVFLFISTGVLAILFSLVAALVLGQMFPKLKLLMWRGRSWMVFTRLCRESLSLASGLAGADPGVVCIFLDGDEKPPEPPSRRCVRFRGTVRELHKLKGGPDAVFIVGPDSFANLSLADSMKDESARICCESLIERSELPENLTVFDRFHNCARLYWQEYPLERDERRVVLIGMGEYGEKLLEQALLVNVFGTGRRIEYHVFGGDGSFQREHTQLGSILSVDKPSETGDTLFFHSGAWNSDQSLLDSADRIMICCDSDTDNMLLLNRLAKYHPIVCPVHVRLLERMKITSAGVDSFGSCDELFSPELVIKERLNRIAVAMNEIYRSQAGGDAPEWSKLPLFGRQSSMAAADHLLTKIRLLLPDDSPRQVTGESCRQAFAAYSAKRPGGVEAFRRIEHERWMRFLYLNNWRRADERNNRLRLHPMLVPYEQLSPADQAKDDGPWLLLEAVGRLLDAQDTENGEK